jgi:fructokinase
MLDPNIRPAAALDPDRIRARLTRILERADVVKVSTEDLAWLVPGADPESAARGLLDRGAACALVTDGQHGARIVTGDSVTDVPAVAVTVADTVGAGDAYCAGFLAWWSAAGLGPEDLADAGRLREAAGYAALVAAMTCERVGATPPTGDEVARFAAARA